MPYKFNRLPYKRWFGVRSVSFGFPYVNVNGLLFSVSSISHNIVSNSSCVTVFMPYTFLKQRLTHLISLSHISNHQGVEGGLQFHLTFLELRNVYDLCYYRLISMIASLFDIKILITFSTSNRIARLTLNIFLVPTKISTKPSML